MRPKEEDPLFLLLEAMSYPDNPSRAIEASEKAQAWLDANYPDWRNPLAYWD